MKTCAAVATTALLLAGATAASLAQTGALTGAAQRLQSELLISTLTNEALRTELESATGTIEHTSEVARTGPVAAVLRVQGCEADAEGRCRVNADIVVRKPDGSVHSESKALDLPLGRGAVPLTFESDAPPGVYTVEATVRDLTARRFSKVERRFGVK